MQTANRAGRLIGILIILHMLGSGIVNFFMEKPLAGDGFLTDAAPTSQRIGIAVILALVTEALWVAIAITAFPIFFQRTQRMAVWIVALAVVGLAVAALENVGAMSMVSLSEAYTKAGAIDREQLRTAGIVVTAARDWPHFISRMFTGVTSFVFFSVLYRFVMAPRVLTILGLVAAVLMVTSVAMPLIGHGVIFPLLAPMGLAQLLLAVWLIAKGFRLH